MAGIRNLDRHNNASDGYLDVTMDQEYHLTYVRAISAEH